MSTILCDISSEPCGFASLAHSCVNNLQKAFEGLDGFEVRKPQLHSINSVYVLPLRISTENDRSNYSLEFPDRQHCGFVYKIIDCSYK